MNFRTEDMLLVLRFKVHRLAWELLTLGVATRTKLSGLQKELHIIMYSFYYAIDLCVLTHVNYMYMYVILCI